MRVLVTGANGFMGTNLCEMLRADGMDVRGLVLAGTPTEFLESLGVEVVPADITQPSTLKGVATDCEWLFHLAGAVGDFGPREWFQKVNVHGTRNMLDAARGAGVKRFVFMSTLAVHGFYGFFQGTEHTWRRCSPRFHYGQSKKDAEDLCAEYHQKDGPPVTVIRPGVFPFGPHDFTSFARLIEAFRDGQFGYVNGGQTFLCTAYVENLCRGLIQAAASEKAAGHIYNLTDEAAVTWRELGTRLASALHLPPPRLNVPKAVALPLAMGCELGWKLGSYQGLPPLTAYRIRLASTDFHFSSRKARKHFDFDPQVPLDEAIDRTVSWFRSKGLA